MLDLDRRIDLNRAIMPVVNNGSYASDLAVGAAGFIFPRGTTNTAVFTSGLWLGCTVNGLTRTVVAEYSQEFAPGAMVGGTFDDPTRPEYAVFKVVRYTGSPDDTAHVFRTPAELGAVPGLDPLAHHSWSEYMSGAAPHGAPWRTYRLPITSTPDPTDSTDVPGPDVMGDQMLWCVFNDADQTQHNNQAGSSLPLGVEIQQTTFAYDRPGPLEHTQFVQYKILNKGANLLENVYVSTWSDPDIGGPTDDLVGFDLGRMMGYAYNATNADLLYGAEPPAVGYTLLRAPAFGRVTSFNKYINGTDPASASDTYHYMQGLLPDGSPIIDPTTGFPTTYFVPGDPLAGTGWIDSAPSDRRMLLSNGPFTLAPNDTAEMLVAIVVGHGQGNLASIADLRCSADYIQQVADFNFQEPFQPPPTSCMAALNCPRDLAFWADKCPDGGGELTPDQLMIIATFVGQRSTFFDWNEATQQFCDLVSSGPGDLRHQAQQQYAALLANFEAGRIGIIPSSKRPITLLPITPIQCAGTTAQNVIDLVATGALTEGMIDALYLNDNATNRRPIEGVNFGLPFFNGGAATAFDFFGSTLDPTTQPDSFATVELRFSTSTPQRAYRYLRLETQTGGPPTTGREYRYAGYHDVPFTAWDVETGQQLEVGFVERAVTDENGVLLSDDFQPATRDSTWRPDDSPNGGREYLFVFKLVYGPLHSQLTQDGVVINGNVPGLYTLASRLRSPGDQFDEGDRFQFVWGVPNNGGVDQQLLELESQDLNDPAVSQAYAQIVDCLTAINNGIGIGAVCDEPTAVTASLISADGQPDRALLTWAVGGERSIVASIERRTGAAWTAVATASPDGSGRIVYEDRDVTAGARYGYRLAIAASGGPMWAGEAWVDIPSAWTLALGGFRPNPAGRGDLSITFTLANAHRATLELYDVAGRRVFGREVGSLGPGNHLVRLDEARRLNPGVYLVRLEQDSRSIKTKAALLR